MLNLITSRYQKLKKERAYSRLALEIGIILIIKIMLLWLLWYACFSHPIPKDTRQSAVTRIILNQPN